MQKINWKTTAATNDADSPEAALALANRLAEAWKGSSQATEDYHYSHKKRRDYEGRKLLRSQVN